MSLIYQYQLIPKDPHDLKRYFWSKSTGNIETYGYDESGARASLKYNDSIFVFNGYVENFDAVFCYKIDQQAYWVEETTLVLDTSIGGKTSQCFIDANIDIKDIKLIPRGHIQNYGSDYFMVAKCIDPIYNGLVLIKITVNNDLALANTLNVSLITLTYSPQEILQTEEVIDTIGIYEGILYFIGKQPSDSGWRNLWSVVLYDNNYSIGEMTLPGINFQGRQSFKIIGNKCFATGDFDQSSQLIWIIDLQTKTTSIIDYSSSVIKLPYPCFNPVITSKGTQLLVLGQSTDPNMVGEVVRIDTATMYILGVEQLESNVKKKLALSPRYIRSKESTGIITILRDYSGSIDTVYSIDFMSPLQFTVSRGATTVGTYAYGKTIDIDYDDIKFNVSGNFELDDSIKIQCGVNTDHITANNGFLENIFHYYFDTRSGILWVANIVDTIPLNTNIQLYNYSCKFNGVVRMNEKIHSKIDDTKYIVTYK